MKYIICEKPGQFLLKEKAPPKRAANEALLRVKMVGICGTDLHAYAGNQAFFTYPRILGHELAAEVIDIGENYRNIKIGDKVVIIPYLHCGKCIACNSGKTNCCANIKVLGVHIDGGMQEQISVPTDLLLPANHLSDYQMAIVEPLAIGAHAIRRAAVKADETVVVIGCGPIGIGIIKLAQIAGAKVIVVDINKKRLQYVQEKIGVEHIVNAADNPVAQIAKITDNDMAKVVFDATGHKTALESGPDYMAHGGKFILVGLSKGILMYHHPAIHAKEMTLMCSRNATVEDFEYVINILDQFPATSFITHNVSLTEMIANFNHWLDPESGVIKATVNF